MFFSNCRALLFALFFALIPSLLCAQKPRFTTESLETPGVQQSVKEFKSRGYELYLEMMDFRGKDDFHFYGFGIGGPYRAWDLKQKQLNEDIKKEFSPVLIFSSKLSILTDLWNLGWAYCKSKGQETPYTQDLVAEYEEYFKDMNNERTENEIDTSQIIEWEDIAGKKLNARFIGLYDKKIYLENQDGKIKICKLSNLSISSQEIAQKYSGADIENGIFPCTIDKKIKFVSFIERDENAYTLLEKYKEEKKFLKSRVSKTDREKLDFM